MLPNTFILRYFYYFNIHNIYQMAEKEAKARIKINKLLEEAGWTFFDTERGKATIKLESAIKMDDLGDDFERTKNGFVDFLLVD